MEMTGHSDIDLLLVGKTGNGKSATGNTILDKRMFATSCNQHSATSRVSWDVRNYNGQVIKVVDAPGVEDTRMTSERAVDLFKNAMEFAVMANPRGYHAFLLTLRFGGRFTREDKRTVAVIKKVFGEDFVKDYCIVVMTHGDNFAHVSEETGQTFSDWINSQTGDVQALLQECKGRVVLFDNVTKDQDKRAKQLNELLMLVSHLSHSGQRYTDENFRKAYDARERLQVESKLPVIRDETMCQVSLILQRLSEIQGAFNSTTQLQDLEKLGNTIHTLVENITKEDKGTGALKELIKNVESIRNTIQEAIAAHKRVKEERARAERHEAEVAAKLKEQREEMMKEMQRQSEEEKKAFQRRLEEFEEISRRRQEEAEIETQRNIVERQKIESQTLAAMRDTNQRDYTSVRVMIDSELLNGIMNITKGIFTTIANWFMSSDTQNQPEDSSDEDE